MSEINLVKNEDLEWWNALSDFEKKAFTAHLYCYDKVRLIPIENPKTDEERQINSFVNMSLVADTMGNTFNIMQFGSSSLQDSQDLSHLLRIKHFGVSNVSDSMKTLNLECLNKLLDLDSLVLYKFKKIDLNLLDTLFKQSKISTLFLGSNSISNLEQLTYLTNLKSLKLKISSKDLIKLPSLPNLESLSNSLYDFEYFNWDFLSKFKNIKQLDLSKNFSLHSISSTILSQLEDLESLSIEMTGISNISELDCLSKLKELNVGRNNISDISGLKSFIHLEKLILQGNSIGDVSILQHLPNLTYLDLTSTNISDISVVSYLKNLKHLYVAINNIESLTYLDGLTELEYLEVSAESAIKDISILKGLPCLKYLSLSGCTAEITQKLREELPNVIIR